MNKNETIVNVNGQDAVMFSANPDRKLAVVDLEVLKQLTGMLQNADFDEVIASYRTHLNNVSNLKEAIQVSEDFVAFHKTVNMIVEYSYDPSQGVPGPEKSWENNY
jgi:hypothetical protein